MRSCGIHLRVILQEMLKISSLDMNLNITNLRLQLHFPGANESQYLTWNIWKPLKIIFKFLCKHWTQETSDASVLWSLSICCWDMNFKIHKNIIAFPIILFLTLRYLRHLKSFLMADKDPLTSVVNTLRLRQDGRRFPDDIFKWIFLNENV